MVRRSLLVLLFLTIVSGSSAFGQSTKSAGVGITVDSLHVQHLSMDSLLKADSLLELTYIEEQRKLDNAKQFATQREIDVTNDGKPEVLRLVAKMDKRVDRSKLTFTIRSGKKLLLTKTWSAAGYFDTLDHLSDSVKRRRLRRTVAVFFANENFTVLDSAEFATSLRDATPADVIPGSAIARELFTTPRVSYNVFESRDYWYGIVWLPSKKTFVKVWRN